MLYGAHSTSVRRNLEFLTPADMARLAPTPRELHSLQRADELIRQMRGEIYAPTLLDRTVAWVRRLHQ